MALRPNLHPLLGFAPPMHPLFRQGVQGDNDCMKCNVTGKTILPLCTNEGSGMGGSERDIKKACPGAVVKSGLSVTGSEAANAAGRVKKWLAANVLA